MQKSCFILQKKICIFVAYYYIKHQELTTLCCLTIEYFLMCDTHTRMVMRV